jgi:ribosomal protein S17
MDKLVADGAQPVVFDYLFDTKIYGEYITKSSTEFKSMLDTIIDANPESQLVIVVKDAESISKYNSYSSRYKKIKVITADKIQGDEGDFFFFDNTYDPQNKSINELLLAKYKEFYTMISRSKIGTVILDEGGYIKSDLNIECVEKKDSSRTTNSNDAQDDEYGKKFNVYYGTPTGETKPVEVTPDDPVLPIRASLQNIRDMYIQLDDQQLAMIDEALDVIKINEVIKYGDGINPSNNKLNVKFGT